MISVLILTRNEEQDLPGCLQSVQWSDDITVLDSLSTDQTQAIARQAGAHVVERAFDNWASHQNWALRHLPFRHDWVLYLDADERLTPDAAEEMQTLMRTAKEDNLSPVAYRLRRRDFFQGRHLRHVQTSPWYIRLFKPTAVHYERLVNPVTCVTGSVGHLTGYLDHYPFSKGLNHWFQRHNAYSSLEAKQIINNRLKNERFSLQAAFFERDFHRRRVHQKELFYRLPARPLFKFLLLYLLKRGFLDGQPGLIYAMLQAIYEQMIVLKVQELEGTAALSRAPGP